MSRSLRTATGPVAGAVVALVVLVVAWRGLYQGVGSERLGAICAAGALPALAMLLPRGRAALVPVATMLSILVAASLATRGGPWGLVAFDPGAWTAVAAIVPDGLAAGSDASLPVSPLDEPALVALLDLALAVLAAAAAWQIVARRRPVAGLSIVGVGLAYRWTVEPPASSGVAGATALAAVVVVLALCGWEAGASRRPLRHLAGALVLGGATVAVAAGLGAGPAKAGDPWWSWKQWDLSGAAGSASGGGLDLSQRYGKLDWPSTPRVAFTVATDRPRPLRAVSLGEFDGISFTLAESVGSEALPFDGGAIVVPGSDPSGLAVTQDITLSAVSSPVVLASGRPERILGSFEGPADLVGDAIRLGAPLQPGDRYRVRTRIPQPGPTQLVNAGPLVARDVPAASTRLRPGYWARPVDIPLWESSEAPPDDRELGPYAPVRDLARRVVGDAASPYAAVNRIEAYLRSGYVYDEEPPYPTSLPDDASTTSNGVDPPLVDFLLNSRRGFCQQFAGSMAVMLRSVGIPARVAVGYTGGRYDVPSGRWRVLDRDAHSWVEVWFPGHGWLPFDPTPGRSAPNPASVSSPDYAPTPFEIDLGGIADAAVDPPSSGGEAPSAAPDPVDPAVAGPSRTSGEGGFGWRWALLALAAPLLVAPSLRRVRRLRGRRGGDERTRVVAAARELEASLTPLGWAPPAAASPSERAEAIHSRTGVDPSGLYRRAALARFAPEPPARGEAAAAWGELAAALREIRRSTPRGRRLMGALGIRLPSRGSVG